MKPVHSTSLQLTLSCDLSEVRPATLAVRNFLSDNGFPEEILASCELAVAEGANNAIQYVSPANRSLPIHISVVGNFQEITISVFDHTPGFEWTGHAHLPSEDSECGRGLFLIQCLMEEVNYFQGHGGNCLHMVKKIPADSSPGAQADFPSATELQQQLGESRQIINEMAEELSSCYESLSAIFRYGSKQDKHTNLKEFSSRLMNDLMEITGADFYLLRLVPKGVSRLVVFTASDSGLFLPPLELPEHEGDAPLEGVPAEVQAAITRKNVRFDKDYPLNASDPLARTKPNTIGLVHPIYFGDTIIGTLTMGKLSPRLHFTAAQINVLHTFADFLAIEIVNARFEEERVNNLLVARDLEIAKNIQRSLLLDSLPQLPGFGVAAYCESARQVGGDFYDVLKCSDHSLLLVIADVMGKGVPAAMFAAILRSLLRSMPHLLHQPGELLTQLNRLLFEELSSVDMFITAQLVYVDASKKQLVAASAGHCPALLAVASNEKVRMLSPDGMPLGILADATFTNEYAELRGNSRVLMYTDGLPEAVNPNGDLFGQQRLMDWLRSTTTRNCSAAELKAELIKQLRKFQENSVLHDDQTFLIMSE